MHFKKSTGVTLVELMVVIAVLLLLVLAAGTISYTFSKKQVITEATTAINAIIQKARATAIQTNTDLYLNVQTGTSWCVGLTNNSSGCDCQTTSCTVNGKSEIISNSDYNDLSLSLTHSPSLGNNATIVFDKIRGRIFPDLSQPSNTETTPILFSISNSNNDSLVIHLNKWGTTDICSNNVGGYPSC